MNHSKLAIPLMIGALFAPVAGYAAEKSMTQSTKEAISDSVITTKIKAAYAKDKLVSAMRVKVDTDDKGMVTLSGNARSKEEADQAEKLARDTQGVTSVRNNIAVGDSSGKPSTTASVKENVGDAAITTRIKSAFVADRWVRAKNIHVNTDDKGVVTLTGNALNIAESDQAEKIARETKGVTSVSNNIVVGAAGSGKSTTASVKENFSDAMITTKIKAEFAKDKQVSAISVTVDTDNKGVVTLSGNAKSKAEADQAARIARATQGVTAVRNNIVVGATGSDKSVTGSDKSTTASVKENFSDAMITTKIKAEFAKDKQVSAMSVKVDTDDKGVVTLSGTAKSKAEADQAARIARETKGVTTVKNDIVVQAK